MILTTRQKRQILSSPPTHILIDKQQLHEVSEYKLLGVAIDNNLTSGPQICDLCKSTAKKGFTSQQKLRTFSPFMLEKHFSKHIFNFAWTVLQLFGILQVSLC